MAKLTMLNLLPGPILRILVPLPELVVVSVPISIDGQQELVVRHADERSVEREEATGADILSVG